MGVSSSRCVLITTWMLRFLFDRLGGVRLPSAVFEEEEATAPRFNFVESTRGRRFLSSVDGGGGDVLEENLLSPIVGASLAWSLTLYHAWPFDGSVNGMAKMK